MSIKMDTSPKKCAGSEQEKRKECAISKTISFENQCFDPK